MLRDFIHLDNKQLKFEAFRLTSYMIIYNSCVCQALFVCLDPLILKPFSAEPSL